MIVYSFSASATFKLIWKTNIDYAWGLEYFMM